MQAAFFMHVVAHDLRDRFCIGSRNMEGSDVAAALDKRDNGAFRAHANTVLVRAIPALF